MAFRRVLTTVILFCYLLISSQSIEFKNSQKPHKIQGPIKTIVVVVMENRSFDHILGWLKSTRPEIDGLTGKESNPLNVSDPNSKKIFVSDDAVFVDMDPGHSFQAIREQIFGSNDTSGDPKMNGFAQQSESMEPGMAKNVMSGFKPEVLPVYTELANEFGVFDRWFASVPTSTQPNRFYVHSATSHGCSSNVKKDLVKGFPQKTIFDSLDENGLSFGIYYQNIPATFFFKSLRRLKHLVKFHSYALKFKLDAKLGKLPNYSVVEQRYFDIDLFPANDDHPSHDVLDSTAKHETNSHGGRYNNPYVHITSPTSASDKRSKDKVLEVLNRCGKKVEDATRKAEALVGGLKDHLKFSPSISDAAMARLSQGTKMIVEGGPERVFQREFGVLAVEKLLDSFVCYISTTSGPVTGVIYISNRRIAFCSDYAIRLPSSAGGNGVAAYYKVVMEWEKISSISSSTNVLKPSERYVHMVTRDGFEFWFMGFVSYIDAFNCLNKALLNSRCDHAMVQLQSHEKLRTMCND